MMPAPVHATGAPRRVLADREIDGIRALARQLAARYRSVEDPEFLRDVTLWSHELPRELRATLIDFKLREPRPGCLIVSGYPIDQQRIGPTPVHWQHPAARATTHEEEIALVLIGSLLGDAFGWATQQAGRVVHEVFPIKGHEHEQLGSSSTALLTWHTEDAFHACRGDYLVLLCLRNPQRAPTTIGWLPPDRLSADERAWLHGPHFTIRPDESHLQKNRPAGVAPPAEPEKLAESYAQIEQMNERPEPIPVLYGHPDEPYLRLDPYFMDGVDEDAPPPRALRALIDAIDGEMRDVVLEAGDFLCVDNFRVVHGRKPFVAAFGGNDRWLKRINVTRDLRKSRGVRASVESRIIRG